MSSIRSVIAWGSGGLAIDIECHLSNGLPAVIIVGLGGKAVEESKERIRSAFSYTKLLFPRKRITLNLAPADIPKDSTNLDLAMAISILAANNQLKRLPTKHEAMIGELSLDGSLRPVRGIIGKIIAGKQAGITTFWIPKENYKQASLISEVTLHPLTSLHDAYVALNSTAPARQTKTRLLQAVKGNTTDVDPFASIAGQTRAKRALLIAAAGGHNIFMYGPPGSGKTMLARAFTSLLPKPSHDEILEITHLHSLASSDYERLITSRPFRAPHHSASHTAIAGGGPQSKPGEVTLSHNGVLFLDEMPEFNKAALESLRQPLEDHIITIARARRTVQYPANFILVATANPCPCGYFGSMKECICTRPQLLSYQQKISGPILDRIDLRLEVEAIDHEQLLGNYAPAQTNSLKLVCDARSMQAERIKNKKFTLNSALTNDELKRYSHLVPSAKTLLDKAAGSLQLSARSYIRIVKVARTIADIDSSGTIEISHISEALQYRNLPSLR